MKIGIIGHLKFPIAKPFAGGLECFTHQLAMNLQARGHSVTLFAAGDSDPMLPVEAVVPRSTIAESQRRLGRVDTELVEALEDEAYAKLMVNLAASDYDIVHNHSLSPIPLRFAATVPVEMVTTLHAPPLPRMVHELRDRGSQRCGRFVNISAANANAWSNVIDDQAIIHNSVDTDHWKICTTSKTKRAIWFGRILADKGTHYAVDAAHQAGLSIDIVGPISDQKYFDQQVEPRLKRGDQYLGHRTHDELCELLSRSAVALVTPCWDEPFGLVVAEALACGTPVAGFARGALPEIVSPHVGQLAPPGDVRQLAEAVTRCLQLNSNVCRRYAQENFGMSRMLRRYEQLYNTARTKVAA
ncbi:glycosyltransferase family 4 protein [Roseimaritima ulvae]|uniref:Glycogen synthase n=1 Tax=Roseimaritima ulvae TaxID=980254 RepID=A0A5B9QMF4_9BACT|nr:glycosyltransferase family 4 protein [Roseimaritima ulvae]QEG39249.1 Glycogen synthase [Roseimaritima ulvae]